MGLRITCDGPSCGSSNSSDTPPPNWYVVESEITGFDDNGSPWFFCSTKCLVEWGQHRAS